MTITHMARATSDLWAVYDRPDAPKRAPRIGGMYLETLCGKVVHRSEIAEADSTVDCAECHSALIC